MDTSKANVHTLGGKSRLIAAKSKVSHNRALFVQCDGVATVCLLGALFKIGPVERNTREMLFVFGTLQ